MYIGQNWYIPAHYHLVCTKSYTTQALCSKFSGDFFFIIPAIYISWEIYQIYQASATHKNTLAMKNIKIIIRCLSLSLTENVSTIYALKVIQWAYHTHTHTHTHFSTLDIESASNIRFNTNYMVVGRNKYSSPSLWTNVVTLFQCYNSKSSICT